MKATHTTTYTADDGTEYTDARLCAAHEQVLAKGEHAYGTIEFEEARDALAATLPIPAVEVKVHLKYPQLYPAFAPATALSAGFDLRWPEREITLLPGERTGPVDLGVSLDLRDLPPCMAVIAPRSGLGSRGLNLANTLGVIDQDYTDLLIATLVNTGRREIVIRTGDRILQLLLVPVLRPTVTLVDAIDPSGRGGLGSTGVA